MTIIKERITRWIIYSAEASVRGCRRRYSPPDIIFFFKCFVLGIFNKLYASPFTKFMGNICSVSCLIYIPNLSLSRMREPPSSQFIHNHPHISGRYIRITPSIGDFLNYSLYCCWKKRIPYPDNSFRANCTFVSFIWSLFTNF